MAEIYKTFWTLAQVKVLRFRYKSDEFQAIKWCDYITDGFKMCSHSSGYLLRYNAL
jgi:hypothetical protein